MVPASQEGVAKGQRGIMKSPMCDA